MLRKKRQVLRTRGLTGLGRGQSFGLLFVRQACRYEAPTGTGVVALIAVWMRSATAFGWESAIECDASTSIVCAPAR